MSSTENFILYATSEFNFKKLILFGKRYDIVYSWFATKMSIDIATFVL